MIKNIKGFTLFEVLVSISVGSILIVMLMSMLSTTLITKNEIDYVNRLDQEVYTINKYLNDFFQDYGYRSITDLSDDVDNGYAFLLTKEFEVIICDSEAISNGICDEEERNEIVNDRNVSEQNVLLLDFDDGAVYLGPYNDIEGEDIIINRSNYRISDPQLIIHDTSVMNFVCIGTDVRNPSERPCANAFIEFELFVSYQLSNSNQLSIRRYFSTLYY